MFRYHTNIPQTLNAIEEGIAQTPNIHEIQYAWEWLNGREDWASTSSGSMDPIHPNDNGQNNSYDYSRNHCLPATAYTTTGKRAYQAQTTTDK